ncbi:hypothetical protein MPER_09480 [Moniliophthora perniciosa FA553]|nr:hypothetical protein MPER_09480 [Moniliophthora perniciosa FA553]
MLICLLRKRQPAIIIDTDSIILFWLDGKAWMTRGTGDYPWPKEILNLPITPQSPPKAPEHGFIWALIDVDRSSDLAAARLFNYPMFPIQSASPDPKHYRRWMKQRYLAVPRTLPLWTKEKLLQLLQVHDSFGRLDSLTQTALERGEQATGMGLVWEDHLFTVLKTVPIPFTTKNEADRFSQK